MRNLEKVYEYILVLSQSRDYYPGLVLVFGALMNFIKALCGLVIIFTGMYLFVYEPQIDKEEEEYCYWFFTHVYDESVDEPLMKTIMDFCKDKYWVNDE